MAKKKKTYKLGEVFEFGNIYYQVKYINQGFGFLAPMDDIPEIQLYYCCVAIKLDQYGNITVI